MLEIFKMGEDITREEIIRRYYHLRYFGWDMYKGVTFKYFDPEIQLNCGTLAEPQWMNDPEQPAFVRKYLKPTGQYIPMDDYNYGG